MTPQFQSGPSKFDRKRSRSSNFSKEEELLLLHEVAKFKNIIECKATNKVTLKEKEQAWAKIGIAYNDNAEAEVRKIEQLQSKYDNLKSKARKVVAQERKYLHGTGGGPAHNDTLDPVVEAILKIINYTTVVGLPSKLDSDYVETETVSHLVEVPYCSSEPFKENIEPTHAVNVQYSNDDVFEIEYINRSPREVVSKVSTCQNGNHSTVFQQAKEIQTDNNATDWSNYTPIKLKKKTSKQLRPIITNPLYLAKQQYYQLKMELLKKEDERKQMEFQRKQENETEEHKQKMILLDLQIVEMKKKQQKE